MYNEEDYLLMSGIQHFDFCRRQWALIHIEQQWVDNFLTADGRVEHKRCHDETVREKRGNTIICRGMRVVSHRLCLTGVCDVVEFCSDESGITLNGYDGRWKPIPIEYKHGESKTIDADRLQLCAQAIALEEMLVCKIEYGFLFYEKTRRREKVNFDESLRKKTVDEAVEMMQLYSRGHTPKEKKQAKCSNCSLKDICLPSLEKKQNVIKYIDEHVIGE